MRSSICWKKTEPRNDKYYYNDYVFYENSRYDGQYGFPRSFMMPCYNETNHTLVFIGMYSGCPARINKKYLDDIEGSWVSFIDQYYGEHYDFSQ